MHDNEDHLPLPCVYRIDNALNPRVSRDKKKPQLSWKFLVDLCKWSQLRIVIGRVGADANNMLSRWRATIVQTPKLYYYYYYHRTISHENYYNIYEYNKLITFVIQLC